MYQVPKGDALDRAVCTQCQHIHYQNPKLITGTLCLSEDKVLLCRRAIEPRYGLWTLPAGFMELNEACENAALRETAEEACAYPVIRQLYTVISLPHIGQVYMIYLADMAEPKFAAGEESLEVQLFSEQEIPWETLAFKTVTQTLQHYFHDRKHNQFPLRTFTIASK